MAQCQGSRALKKDFFWSSPVLGRKILRKSQSAWRPTQCKSGLGNNRVLGVTIYCTFFNNNSLPPLRFLCYKILLKKISYNRGMLIEQIFELKGAGPLGRINTSITGCFHHKTIISKENIRLDCYVLLKFCTRQCA